MSWLKKNWLVVAIVVLVIGTLVNVVGIFNKASSSTTCNVSSGCPTATASVATTQTAVTHTASLGVISKNYSGAITLPQGMVVLDSTGNMSPSVENSFALAWYRSELYRQEMWSTGNAAIESHLLTANGVDSSFNHLVAALQSGHQHPVITGTPSYALATIYPLTSSDQTLISDTGAGGSSDYAWIVSEIGPETVTVGHATYTPIPGSNQAFANTFLFAGSVVQDPKLGAIWQSNLIYTCGLGDITSVGQCFSSGSTAQAQ